MHFSETNLCKENDKPKHIKEVLEKGDVEVKVELIKCVSDLVELLIHSVFDDEVEEKVGKRYEHNKNGIYRWGTNPGSVRIGMEKVRIKVPRLRDGQTKSEITLDSYNQLKETDADDEQLLKGVIHGLSMNDYNMVVRQFENSFGLSRSSVSNMFKEISARRLENFFNRDLSTYDFAALLIDGKYLAREQIVIALGITTDGKKIILGFAQTTSENALSIKGMLDEIIGRGFRFEEGILCIIDGSRGIHKAVKDTFGECAIIKRCSWHKRENMLSYLSENRKDEFKKRYNEAYSLKDYQEAKNAFIDLADDLAKVNLSASRSIMDGLDELLTLHRLNLISDFGTSFSSTNMIENLNSQLAKYLNKVKCWKNSDQRFRWVASAFIEIEPRLKRVQNYSKLHILKETIKIEVEKRKFEKGLGTS